ncbi:hypothetical protein [Bacillus marinisedimentorum]|uniref:hypothetical protein n=1 Tax=Bacillus marinisedimentorum TaxID=1821260 RepID=UPI0007DE8C0C|nr:hypothetical protein [Bacillus marinisedimentorum]
MEVMEKARDQVITAQTVLIPFGLSCNPMRKLAIINFEKHPEEVYKGLELQNFNDAVYGNGYRVIAYRLDGYVDVYDDLKLNDIDSETFEVAGKGLCERKRVDMENVLFEVEEGCATIAFSFTDKFGRRIAASIQEYAAKESRAMNLLAPIGASTENPSYLPLFFLHEFDFIRKWKTDVKLTIDGKKIKQDNFPVRAAVKDFQRRYYSRYTPDCQIIEFARAGTGVIEECIPDASGQVISGALKYKYRKGVLHNIKLKHPSHSLSLKFGLGFPDIRNIDHGPTYRDTFKIVADDTMGYVSGEYSIKREGDSAKIELIPSGGWTPVPNSFLTNILLGEKSIFCSWPRTYKYTQQIDLLTLESVSRWERTP